MDELKPTGEKKGQMHGTAPTLNLRVLPLCFPKLQVMLRREEELDTDATTSRNLLLIV